METTAGNHVDERGPGGQDVVGLLAGHNQANCILLDRC